MALSVIEQQALDAVKQLPKKIDNLGMGIKQAIGKTTEDAVERLIEKGGAEFYHNAVLTAFGTFLSQDKDAAPEAIAEKAMTYADALMTYMAEHMIAALEEEIDIDDE